MWGVGLSPDVPRKEATVTRIGSTLEEQFDLRVKPGRARARTSGDVIAPAGAGGAAACRRSARASSDADEEMEPGGFEPPCRDGRPVASTRVFGRLISAPAAAANSLRGFPAPGSSSPTRPRAALVGQPDVCDHAPIRRRG